MNLNRHDIIGRVGNDPYINTTTNGSKQAKISVATNYVYFKNEEKVEQTDWHTVVLYGKIAETCEKYVKKGQLIYISGRHQMRQVEEQGSKKPRIYSEIIADKLLFLEKNKKEYVNNKSNDDLPF